MFLSYILLTIFVYILWLFYLELSPRIGGIVFRPNSDGNLVFSTNSIINITFYPFKNYSLWYPTFWDLNIFIILLLILSIFYFL
jgi:hypothetical protein